jgi:LL-diaminopimelate aminotransferase
MIENEEDTMNILADRLKEIPPYLFMELRKKIQQAKASGVDVISLAIGDPVEATPSFIIEELQKQALDPANHPYPTDEERGMLAFRQAVARLYQRKYQVNLDPATEIIGLIGSKEGVHHFMLACVNPGDIVLMTDPGYPAYRANIYMAGGQPYEVPILAKNNFLPDLEQIPQEICNKAKAFFLNYPNNPTGACATASFFAQLVTWAKKHQILIVHDNPYSEIVFQGGKKLSLLQTENAKDIAVEFNSLSKPYNMTGWRIGMAMGKREIINALSKVKENVDSGIFNPIQYAGIKALDEGDTAIEHMMQIYQKRRDLVLQTFAKKGIAINAGPGTFYLWLPVPKGSTSIDYATRLFEQAHVVVAAGSGYGRYGEGFFRVSLTVPDNRLEEAMNRILKQS